MKINSKAFCLASGILMGLTIFLATLWSAYNEGGNTLIVLNRFYLGYTVTLTGAFVGLAWGFVHGLIGGLVFSLIYNGLCRKA